MNHNNIYSILGKLQNLTPKAEPEKETAPQKIYESVEARGSITEGIGSVEQRLSEKYMGFKKTVEESGLQYYTGKKKYGKDGMAALAKAGREGANQEELGRIKDKYIKNESEKTCKKCGMVNCKCDHSKMEESVCKECGMTEGSCEHTNEGEYMGQPAKYGVCIVGHNGGKPVKIFDTEAEAEAYAKKGIRVDGKLLQGSVRTIVGEGETTRKDGVTKHTKTDYPGYQSDSDDDKDDDEPRKAGRPRKHAKKADTGEKKGRGRPKKEKAPEYDKRHDPFGRVKPGAEKSGKEIKGKKHHMDEKAKSVAQQRFMGMVHAAHKGEKAASPAVAKVARGMTQKAAKDYAATKYKGLPQHVTEGINFAEMLKEKHATVDEMLAELSNDIKMFKETGHCSELLRDCMDLRGYASKQMAEVAQTPPPAKGTDLVTPQQRLNPPQAPKPGIVGAVKDVAKGVKNWITGKPDQGPTYEEVTLEDELNELAKLAGLSTEGNAFTGKLKATPKGGKFELDGKTYTDTSTLDEEPNEGNAFTGKLAQTKKGDKFELDGKEFTDTSSLEEEKIDVADAPESKNKPKPKYASIKSITTQGDDLHREKSQNPGAAAKGDNPLTNENVFKLEARLAAEYESIKKAVK